MSEPEAQLAEDERLARLQGEARDRRWPNVRPKDAATLILVDRSGAKPRVLMGKRHEGHRFMPGKFVFPGGRAERGDRHLPLARPLAPDLLALGLALAAIRETFEETGLLIGRPATPSRRFPGPWEAFGAAGLAPDPAALMYLARAITPPRRPKRFDTRFFVAERSSIGGEVGGIVGPDSELTELAWLTLADTADLPLPAITRVVLADLDSALRNGGPHPGLPVPFYYERGGRFRRDLLGTE